MLLAISSAVAYGIAFQFETGYADCFGYPHWLIDIGLSNVLLAWTSIALGLLVLVVTYFIVGLLPARWIGVLLLNRATLVFVAAGMMVIAGALLVDEAGIWFSAIYFGAGGAMLVFWTILWMEVYRGTDALSPTIERVVQTSRILVPPVPEAEGSDRAVKRSLLAKTVEIPAIGRLYASSLVLLPLVGVVMFSANSFGQFRASRQFEFWVSSDRPPVVALRRYGDNIIATTLASSSFSRGPRQIKVLPWQSSERTWTIHFGVGRTHRPLACR